MRHIYNMKGLMEKTGITDYAELQRRGYDARGWLIEMKEKLESQLEMINSSIDELDNELNNDEPDDEFMGFDSSRSWCDSEDSEYFYLGT